MVLFICVHGGAMSFSSCDKMNERTPLPPTGWINRINLIFFDSREIDLSKVSLRTVY